MVAKSILYYYVMFFGTPNNRNPLYFQEWYISNFFGLTFPEHFNKTGIDILKLSFESKVDVSELFAHVFKEPQKNSQNDIMIPNDFQFLVKNMDLSSQPDFFEKIAKTYEQELKHNSKSVNANLMLGLYEKNKNNNSEAIKHFENAKSDARALRLLALCLNEDTEADKKMKLLLDSAIMGKTSSLYHIAVGLDTSKVYQTFFQNLENECKTKASHKDCDYETLMTLGILTLMLHENSVNESISYFERASRLSYPASNFYLGLIYERGFGTIEPDIKKAIEYYQIAAKQNHFYSLIRLAIIFYYGNSYYDYLPNKYLSGKEKMEDSDKQALFYFEKCISFDDAVAYKFLAWYHMDGAFTNYDRDKAKFYAEKGLFCSILHYYNEADWKIGIDYVCIQELCILLGYYYYYYFENKNEKCIEYYNKAANVNPKWFFSKIYKQKAEKRIKEKNQNINLQLEKQSEPKNLTSIKTDSINVATNEQNQIKEQKQEKHIMISYAKETRKMTELLQNALEKCGFKVWVDYKDMKNHIFKDMANGVENASHIIACISEYYEASEYCQKELSYAISSAKKPIIPIIVQESYSPKGWIGLAIAGIKYYRVIDEKSLESFFPQILQIIDNDKYNEIVQSKVCSIS